MKRLFCISWLCAVSFAQPPRLFYTDLESAPNSGGERNAGAYVTLYGRGFGVTRGSSFVTIGGGLAAGYPVWTDTKVTIQLGSQAKSGDLVAHTERGVSNPAKFQVRSGNIYFVGIHGNDGAAGSVTAPWKSLIKARDATKPGDIVYAMDGVAQTADDGYGWSAALTLHAESGGTASAPKAFVVYPGATATIGSVKGPRFGLRSTGRAAHWTFAGFVLRGAVTAAHVDGPSTNWRFIANDMSCPENVTGSCFSTSKTSFVQFLGNNVHDVGLPNASALNHGVYFTTDSNHIDAGWNIIANVRGCRGLQVHSTAIETGTGHNQYDILIHDNVIHDTQCDGIVLATVDPSKGPVEVRNNVIYNAGKGPNNPERTGHWSCILISGYTNGGVPGGGTVEVYNNTLYNCGAFAQPPYDNVRSGVANAGRNQNLHVRIRNNIIVPAPGVPYLTMWGVSSLCTGSECGGIYGANNLFFGSGRAPLLNGLTGSINADPQFVEPLKGDFRLRSGSPARNTGVDTGREKKESGYDLGALPSPQT